MHNPKHDPLDLWRGIDDAIWREAAAPPVKPPAPVPVLASATARAANGAKVVVMSERAAARRGAAKSPGLVPGALVLHHG